MTPTGSCPRIEPGLDRVFAADDVHVGAADGRRRDADDGFAGPGVGFGTSSTAMRSLPLNTTAFMVFIAVLLTANPTRDVIPLSAVGLPSKGPAGAVAA